ncbi:hypothetical protein BN1804_00171 [Proteus penneri]|uniref:Uncharacterized protein n=2 Tax=Proteus penneri TaxID=102862 RepID=A0A0G4PZF6_9GAMM|nr:hypothetical protein BN1804_00171 [Proteus penneri]
MEKLTNVIYGTAGLTAFFASLSFLVTYFIMTCREQRKRIQLFEEIVRYVDPQNPTETLKRLAELMVKVPKDI